MRDSAHSRTYLVTGGAGFVGSHLAEELLWRGNHVIVLDDLSTGSFENVRHLSGSPLFRFVEGSVLDEALVGSLAAESEVIAHLAASVGVGLVMKLPASSAWNNVAGTEVVLEAATRHGLPTLVASSSEVYGRGSRFPFGEEDDVVLGATSIPRFSYAASKMVDEFLALGHGSEHGLPVACFRLFNTVGARQSGRYGMVIPRFVDQAIRGEPILVYGDGRQRRCFCGVGDAVEAIIRLSKALLQRPQAASGGTYNVGATEEVTISELARRVCEVAGSSSEIFYVSYEEAYGPGFEDMRRRVPDIERIRSLTGWEPAQTLQSVLEDAVRSARASP